MEKHFCWYCLATGAAFNLLCTESDKKIMERIERHFNHFIREVELMLIVDLLSFFLCNDWSSKISLGNIFFCCCILGA